MGRCAGLTGIFVQSSCQPLGPVMRVSYLICSLALVSACGQSKPPPALVVATDKKSGCTLRVPRVYATRPVTAEPIPSAKPWGTPTMTWSGGCVNKRASGDGVVRILSGAKVVGAWYGSAVSGMLGQGVIEDSYGYEAGQMRSNGTLAPLAHDADMALIKRSATIARSYAMQLEKGGNKGSAAYYRGKAEDIGAMLLGE